MPVTTHHTLLLSAFALPGFRWSTLLIGLFPLSGHSADALPAFPPAALQQGGYILFQRHGATQRTQYDHQPVDLSTCDGQRNLSAEGRHQASTIGQAFAQLHIETDVVLNSPYCRTRATAQLAFHSLADTAELAYSFPDGPAEKQRKAVWLQQRLGQPPQAGRVTVLISHSSNLADATGIWPAGEGDTVVFRPRIGGGWEVVGYIGITDWPDTP